jgi:hypothetical protein
MDRVSMVTWAWRALIDAVVPWTLADTFRKGEIYWPGFDVITFLV